MTELWEYTGSSPRVYPETRDPETGGVLLVEPGDVFDFAGGSPPGDGLWYPVPNASSPASTGAGKTEE